ncbi:MAG: SHOCT domain-containing protein [Clostridia bacterium]
MGGFIVTIIILIIIVATPILGISSYKDKKKKDKALDDYINFINKNGLNSSKKVAFKNIVRIDIDTKNKLLGTYSYYENQSKVIKFNEVLDFEIFENGNSVVSSKTGSAVIGGLLFGGLGAVAGASGSRTISEDCDTLKLKIYTNNIQYSVIMLDLLEKGISKSGYVYEYLTEIINEMISFLKIAREHNRQEERKEDKKVIIENVEDIKQNSNLTSIKELAELKEKGIITEKEFEESKKKILEKI